MAGMTGKRPNFIYLGPDKSGSTWLYAVLAQHPQVFMPRAKELFFFDQYYAKGMGWYERHYRGAQSTHRVLGEIAHDYLFSPQACARIARDLPGVRLMASLREPADRAFSSYLYMIRQGRVRGSFEAALETMDELVDHGLYAKHLTPYIETFGRTRVHIAAFDDLRRDPAAYFAAVCGFLGVETMALDDAALERSLPAARPRSHTAARAAKLAALALRHAGLPALVTRIKSAPVVHRLLFRTYAEEERPTMAEETRHRLRQRFKDDVRRLDALTGGDFAERWGYTE